MVRKPRPLTSLSLEKFLQPVFAAYANNGIAMSLNRVDGNVVKINLDKKRCGG